MQRIHNGSKPSLSILVLILLVLAVVWGMRFFSIGLSPSQQPEARTKPYATDNPHKSFLDKAVQDVVDGYVSQYKPIGFSISVLHNGRESYYNYGEAKAGTGVLPTSRTIYEIASITKTMTGILLAHGVLDRKLNLEDDIRTRLPGNFPNLEFAGKPILLKHLATHTSGLPHSPPSIPEDPTANEVERYTHERLLTDLASIRLLGEPGKVVGYSNMGAGLVGLALERAYGLPYEDLLRKFIFGPAKMSHSGIALTPEMDRNYATPYNAAGAQTDRWNVNGTEAAGAVRSNTEDMLGYARLNLDETNPAVALSHKLLSPRGWIGRSRIHYGMFWQRSDSGAWGPNFSHDGNTGGFSTNIFVVPGKKFAVVILMNTDQQPAGQLGDGIAKRILHGSK